MKKRCTRPSRPPLSGRLTAWIPAAAGLAAAGLLFGAPFAGARETRDIPYEAVDRGGLGPHDLAILDQPGFRWKHLQTEHFVLHYRQQMFAARVARLAEQFYEAISADLPKLHDRVSPRRSHIFIFRDARDWQSVVTGRPGLEPWAVSFVAGNVLYLQELGSGSSEKMSLLAHEMAHLVFNRFVTVRLPLWLNEGLAEYYEEFAYRAVRGMGQSRRSAFPPLRQPTPLAELLDAADYPAAPDDVSRFYATSKYLVGYLLLRRPRDRWDAFLAQVLAGRDALSALFETYEWADIPAMEKDFSRFVR